MIYRIIIMLSATISSYAISQSFGYITGGPSATGDLNNITSFNQPTAIYGFGFRRQANRVGYDMEFITNSTERRARVSTLYYPMPNPYNQLYLGFGSSIAYLRDPEAEKRLELTPRVHTQMGIEFRGQKSSTKQFIQGDFSPFRKEDKHNGNLTLTYGIGF